MPKMPWHPASGTGQFAARAKKVIRLARYGCTNRPFYHIVVMEARKEQKQPPIEQLGTFDPLPNAHNEILGSFNFERIQYWMAKGADISAPVAQLFGLAGFLPIHPRSYISAWRNRRSAKAAEDAAVATATTDEMKAPTAEKQ